MKRVPKYRGGPKLSSITALEFAKALHFIPQRFCRSKIAIAVSGGPDSIALLYLLKRYFDNLNTIETSKVELLALTIDHKFRESSSKEAEDVKSFSNSLNIRHETLEIPWSRSPFPPFPSSHLSEAPARTARHLLYHRKLRQEGILGIWMGHHLDDQVENKIIWGYGMRKVAKMDGKIEPSESIDDDVHIVRPLTMFSKSRLLATCKAHQLPYFIDPTNLDPLYTPRNRIRDEILNYQSRHSLHPNLLSCKSSTDIGGPLALLQRVSNIASSSLKNSDPSLESPAITLHSPSLTTATLYPHLHSPSISPSKTRLLLSNLIKSVGNKSGITQRALEETREKLFLTGSNQNTSNSFTPGGGVVFCSKIQIKGGKRQLYWIVNRQTSRKNINSNRNRFELENQVWKLWDERVWIRINWLEREEGVQFFVESRGEYSEPVVIMRSSTVEGEEIIWKLPLKLSESDVQHDQKFFIEYKICQ